MRGKEKRWKWVNRLRRLGLISVGVGSQGPEIKVNWEKFEAIFPRGNKNVRDILKRLEGLHPSEAELLLRQKPPTSMISYAEEISPFNEKISSILNMLKRLGLIEIEDGVVSKTPEAEEIIGGSSLNARDARGLLETLNKIDGKPIEGVGRILIRSTALEHRLKEIEKNVGKEIGEEEEPIEIEVVPPKEYKIQDYPRDVSYLAAIHILGKLIEEGKIDRESVKEALEKREWDKVFNMLREHVTGIAARIDEKRLGRLLAWLRSIIGSIEESHGEHIAHLTWRCPACGSELRPHGRGLTCVACGKTYERPKGDPPELRVSPPYNRGEISAQRDYPHLYPVIVEDSRIMVNPHHPFTRFLRTYIGGRKRHG